MIKLRTVGKYEIVDALGSGGMGTVYRAFDPTLERIVALKILNLDLIHDAASDDLSARFRNEARAVARLNHPAIVSVFDYDDQDPAGPYIAMEYVNGCALDQYVTQRPELHLEDAVSAMQQVLGGVAYAHRQGVVHRDIKPSNLLVTRDGLVKITDFGIAKIGTRNRTQTGLLVGTPQYMAPEQYTGGTLDHRCDIHAAGAVLYELLAGVAPFVGGPGEVMYKICYEVPAPLSSVNPAVPKAFDPIVAQALAKKPDDRYQSAIEFQDALRGAWQMFSRKPASQTLSEKARQIATTMRRAAVPGFPVSSPAAPPPPPMNGPQSAPSPSPEPHPEAPAMAANEQLTAHRPSTGGNAAAADPKMSRTDPLPVSGLGPVAGTAPPPRDIAPPPFARDPEPVSGPGAMFGPSGPAAARVPTGPGVQAGSAAPAPGSLLAWSREQLAEVERQLTPIVGPMAPILVRRAAANTGSRRQLYELLADHLHTPEERRRFLAGEAQVTGPAQGSDAAGHGDDAHASSRISGIQPGRPVTPETTQRAAQLLARYLGPIASVVARKAAAVATDEAHLYAMLADKLQDPAERDRFIDAAGRVD